MSHQASQDLDPVARLRSFIVEGGHPRGGRLPPERHLTEELCMTRTTQRKALDSLERDGLIWRHVGKGTFVADGNTQRATGAAVELGRQLTPFRMMRARMAIEPAIAREAAVNASDEALAKMQRAIDRSKSATTWKDYEIQDDVFHRAVAEAIAPVLAARGLLLVGLDMIGNKVTEINVTSPTCFQEITDQTGFDVPAMFVDALEAALR